MTRILAIIDPEETEHSALNRIREIPASAAVEFKVDLYIDAVPVMAGKADRSALNDLLAEKRKFLETLVEPLQRVGYQIQTEVIAFNRLYEEIIRSAARFRADFLFKPVRQHGTVRRLFYTSTDWNLVRLCPKPLLMVSDETSIHGKPIVAAIDVGDEDEAHRELNIQVLEQANLLGRVLEAEVHAVYAYGPAAVASRAAVGDPLSFQIAHDKYEAEFKAAEQLATSHGVDSGNVHLREGAPDRVVNEYAAEVGAGVIVLGTVARSGAAGLFVGNTAEAALERAATDVFVVKNGNFESPA